MKNYQSSTTNLVFEMISGKKIISFLTVNALLFFFFFCALNAQQLSILPQGQEKGDFYASLAAGESFENIAHPLKRSFFPIDPDIIALDFGYKFSKQWDAVIGIRGFQNGATKENRNSRITEKSCSNNFFFDIGSTYRINPNVDFRIALTNKIGPVENTVNIVNWVPGSELQTFQRNESNFWATGLQPSISYSKANFHIDVASSIEVQHFYNATFKSTERKRELREYVTFASGLAHILTLGLIQPEYEERMETVFEERKSGELDSETVLNLSLNPRFSFGKKLKVFVSPAIHYTSDKTWDILENNITGGLSMVF